jgi:carbonic anhydrase
MDARLMIEDLFGLAPGDAHVIRNAGGLITDDVIRSLALSQRLLGTTEIHVVRHTDCGLHGLDDDRFLADLAADAGECPNWSPGGFDELDAGVREAVATLHASAFLPHVDAVQGFVFEVETGRLREVACDRARVAA